MKDDNQQVKHTPVNRQLTILALVGSLCVICGAAAMFVYFNLASSNPALPLLFNPLFRGAMQLAMWVGVFGAVLNLIAFIKREESSNPRLVRMLGTISLALILATIVAAAKAILSNFT